MYASTLEELVVNRRVAAGRSIGGGVSLRKYAKESLSTSEILDRHIPLNGASHADVINYTVQIPTRYAKCFGALANGDMVGLRDCRQFIGWSGRESRRSFLFVSEETCFEVRVDPNHPDGWDAPGSIHTLVLKPSAAISSDVEGMTALVDVKEGITDRRDRQYHRKFIAIDGSQILLSVR